MGTVNAFEDWFAKNQPGIEKWLSDMAADPVTARSAVVLMGEPFEARKIVTYIDVPDELLADLRAMPSPLPWRWRLRNRIADLRESAARRAYKIIAGEWPHDREDDW